MRVTAYRHQILAPGDVEILAYHWLPVGVSRLTHPHLHRSKGLPPLDCGPVAAPLTLTDIHLPTGYVSLADVARLLIAEFGVEPRRADWEALLRETPMAP